MRLFNFEFLMIRFYRQESNTRTCVSNFIRLCKAIKGILFKYFLISFRFLDLSTLKKIDLYIDRYAYYPVLVPILSDLLPDKIVDLYCQPQTLRHFVRRKRIMDSVHLHGESDPRKTGNFNTIRFYSF
jgi:hypothetical protein